MQCMSSMTSESSSPKPDKVPANNRTISLVLVLVLVSAAITAGAYWQVTKEPFGRHGTFRHHYSIVIEANTTEEYTIRLPVPNDVNGEMPYGFIDDLEVHMGNSAFALANYEYGRGLEVRASGYLSLDWIKAWPESSHDRYGNLTMTIGAEGWTDHAPRLSWIYSDRSDIRIMFNYWSIHQYMATPTWSSGGGPTFSLIVYPEGTGWQQVPIDYGWMLIN